MAFVSKSYKNFVIEVDTFSVSHNAIRQIEASRYGSLAPIAPRIPDDAKVIEKALGVRAQNVGILQLYFQSSTIEIIRKIMKSDSDVVIVLPCPKSELRPWHDVFDKLGLKGVKLATFSQKMSPLLAVRPCFAGEDAVLDLSVPTVFVGNDDDNGNIAQKLLAPGSLHLDTVEQKSDLIP